LIPLRARAFTLIELVMVLAILAIGALVIAPSIVRQSALGERREVRISIANLLRDARLAATRAGVPVEVRYIPSDRVLDAGRKPDSVSDAAWPDPVALPEGWTVWSEQLAAHLERAAVRSQAPTPFTLLVFNPQGLASRSAWTARGPGGEVSIESDAIDGLRVD
jgi:prepilin-type N-terminal cleavage/methylation domain-containing protein